MRKGLLSTSIMLALIAMGSCGGKNERPAVAATTAPQAELLGEIAGDDFDIVTVIPPGAEPETFDPSPSTLAALQKCGVYFTLNTQEFESQITSQAKENFPNLSVIDAGTSLNRIRGTHADKNASDPHYLSSLRNARLIAGKMGFKLASRYPQNAEGINRRAEQLDKRLKALDDSLTQVLHDSYGAAFVVFHPMMSYFARDYGLRQIPLQVEGKEATPKEYRERLDAARDAQPVALFYEKGSDSKRAEEVASELGIKAVEISFNGNDFKENIIKAASTIAQK